MNISKPDTSSEVYKAFIAHIKSKVELAELWLIQHKIDYIWNYWVGNHLYRLYIESIDLLLDFEYYPVSNYDYNYIRVNFDTDILQLLEMIFPTTVIDTAEANFCIADQRECNRFLKENNSPPVYDKQALRVVWVKDNIIYQCIVVKDGVIIRDVKKLGCTIVCGTFMALRYLTEVLHLPEITIKANIGNSYSIRTYQHLKLSGRPQSCKRKIWWSPSDTKWKIKKEDTDRYIPFYYCEDIEYKFLGLR